ncbi:alpha-ketoglutarate-dependent dioxygenase AlkB [Streptomyces sp. NPDC001674]|uniref:alpha-ketoglutarate-dependent dioxygenase AlkB n=1 Tax=unclassified Streptomyces TaxID=2593676 RepID=UPI00332CEB43
MPLGSRISDEIIVRAVPAGGDLFAELSAATRWEDLGKGRQGAVLTRTGGTAGLGVPLVRTTAQYSGPAQPFGPVHERLAQQVREHAGLPAGFNNALTERYTNAYRTMGGHSDQALDLADGSYIAVFSCYEFPEAGPVRKLVFETKGSDAERFEIPLTHHSVVAFSVDSNRRFRHRIVAEAPVPAADNTWLGVTFRTSKTLLRFRDGHAHLPHGPRLTLADDDQRREFYGLRRRENQETDFAYPPLTYTLSPSDLTPPA